jgi:hypothetical protein
MGANYVLLQRVTVNSANAASVVFSNIPTSGYTDLKIQISSRCNGTSNWQVNYIKFGSDTTASNYPTRMVYAFGSTVGSFTGNQWAGYSTNGVATANTFAQTDVYITNYSVNGLTKTLTFESHAPNNSTTLTPINAGTMIYNGSSSPISQITLTPDNGSYLSGSSFSLYGLADVPTTPALYPKAQGGDIITNDGTYWIHTFLSSGVFSPKQELTCDYLVVAGGGGPGAVNLGVGYPSGGGGAGGYRTSIGGSSVTAPINNYLITIGAGGTAAANGSNSAFVGGAVSISSTGGGRGGWGGSSGGNQNSTTGGSGGGGGYGGVSASAGNAGGYTPVEGYSGAGGGNPSGGGGGSSANASGSTGGAGTSNSISGSAVTYARGGDGTSVGGSSGPAATAAGFGNGGNGGRSQYFNGSDANSGVVVIRYSMV